MRSRLSRITTSATTLYKQGYEQPLTCHLDPHSQTEITLRLGALTFQLSFETARTRDLAVSHSQRAADALGVLPPSAARDALLRLCFDVLNRKA